MSETKEKYKMLQTKVSLDSYRRIKQIEKKKGLTSYGIIQMMCDCIVRYMDDAHNLTPEMEQAMSIFEHLEGWKDALNIADPTVDKEIGEALYFFIAKDGGKKGSRAVMIRKPFFGNWTQTFNIQDIFERVINQLSPERYMRLRSLAVDMQCQSILQLIDKLIDEHGKDADIKHIREEFEDSNRGDFGQSPDYARTKQRQKRDMDWMDSQQSIQFDDDDKAVSDEEVERARQSLRDGCDFRPHGYEW